MICSSLRIEAESDSAQYVLIYKQTQTAMLSHPLSAKSEYLIVDIHHRQPSVKCGELVYARYTSWYWFSQGVIRRDVLRLELSKVMWLPSESITIYKNTAKSLFFQYQVEDRADPCLGYELMLFWDKRGTCFILWSVMQNYGHLS